MNTEHGISKYVIANYLCQIRVAIIYDALLSQAAKAACYSKKSYIFRHSPIIETGFFGISEQFFWNCFQITGCFSCLTKRCSIVPIRCDIFHLLRW